MGNELDDNTFCIDYCRKMGPGTLDTGLMQTILVIVTGKCLLMNMQAQGKLQEQHQAYQWYKQICG